MTKFDEVQGWYQCYNPGMKRPRFSLRTLLVLVAIASAPMGWAAYQLNWIRQRHEFVNNFGARSGYPGQTADPQVAPWPLALFGENGWTCMVHVPESQLQRGQELFPETKFYTYPDPPVK